VLPLQVISPVYFQRTMESLMELTWINVADTAVKIGLGALISALSGYFGLITSQSMGDLTFMTKCI